MVDQVINPLAVHRATVAVDRVLRTRFPLVYAEPGKGRGGGFVVMLEKASGLVVFQAMIADCPRERLETRAGFAREKAGRLLGHLPDGHLLSYQSRDESQDRYPGAVAGAQYIYSYSGDPGDMDELKMLAVACRMDDMTYDGVTQALALRDTPNKFFQECSPEMLIDLFDRTV